jgi:prepilin-type N-terminal cleavage/methylation domain-containing protein
MKPRPTDDSVNGFTLLEVLVALTIVGLGVVTLLQIFSLGLRLGARSSVRTEAVSDGARVMDELLARKRLLEGSETGRRAEESRWQVQIQPIRESGSSLNLSNNWELKEVSLEMTVMDAGRERRIDFKTLRLTRKINP